VARDAVLGARPSIGTLLAHLYGSLLGGAVLIEVVFSWGGAGQYAVGAVLNADINAALGFVVFTAVFSLFIYLLADLLHFVIDPRTRHP
jgi:peptide/nickel transport system permease protein